MIPENRNRLPSYQFQLLSESQLADQQLVAALSDFYNRATIRENTDRIYTVEEFAQEVLLNTINTDGGKIIFATTQTGKICGFVAGYNTDFNRQNFQLETDVPEGKYFYMFGLGSSESDPSVVLGLATQLLNGVDADFCVGLVSHDAPIYQREIYQRRGWFEVKSNLPVAKDHSYFFIPRKEVLK